MLLYGTVNIRQIFAQDVVFQLWNEEDYLSMKKKI